MVLLINRLGQNPSFLNGQEIKMFGLEEAKNGDELKVSPGVDFHYKISFDDKNSNKRSESESQNGTKRRSSTEAEGEKENKSQKRDPTPQRKVKPNLVAKWQDVDGGKLLVFTSSGVESRPKIAAYDMDGTIIKTKSGNVFPKNIDDWQIAFPEVPGMLKKLTADGFKIVFFTNQAGITSGKLKATDLKTKIERITSKLNVPIQVFAATGKSCYRKPAPGMWNYLVEQENDGIDVDMKESFYCGDAAGRPELKKPVKRKKDHSSADRLFALNVGIQFFTPEEHFQKKPAEEWIRPEFDPRNFKVSSSLTNPPDAQLALTNGEIEAIVLVGSPASGKSHFAKKYFENYVYINRDTMGTWQKCVAALEKAIQEKKSAIIDNTNPDIESRKRYIDVAKKRKISCRCFLMEVSEKQAQHNNAFREMTDSKHSVLGAAVFGGYRGKFKEPTLKEGFQQIVRVNFIPEFDDPEHEKLYKMYLVEK